MSRSEELNTITSQLREKIKSLPVSQRKAAVSIFSQFVSITEAEKNEETIYTEAHRILNEKTIELTTQTDHIVEGKRTATPEEIQFWKSHIDPNFTPKDGDVPQAIPGFWGKFLLNAHVHSGPHDAQILKHITNISTLGDEKVEDGKTFSADSTIFTFEENPFFTNKELKITMKKLDGEPTLCEGTKIEWITNPTMKRKTKNKKNKKTGEVKVMVKEIQQTSFFELFKDFDAKVEDNASQNSEGEKINIYIVDDVLETINGAISYALEYYLGIVDTGEDSMEEIAEEDEEEEEETKPAAKKK